LGRPGLQWPPPMNKFLFVFAILTPMLSSIGLASPATFFNNLTGNWAGNGSAYLAKAGELSADCKLKIAGGDARVAMKGTCGLFIFRQGLGFTLQSAGGNKYIGTYTGSKTGPARLAGTLHGKQLRLTITWGGLVNGDRTAEMILTRTGPNTFVQTVVDEVSGKSRNTSNFNFTRS
jgi:hypothetical protein